MGSTTIEPQHLRALDRANEVRLARAQLKRNVGAGALSASEVVLDSPWEVESMKLIDLLMSQRRWGRTRCRKFLLPLGISENKPIGELTQRQRTAIASMLTKPSTAISNPTRSFEQFRDRRLAAV